MMQPVPISDGEQRGRMPQENVSALRAFLQVKRQSGDVPLSRKTQRKLDRFLESIAKMRSLDPDGDPDQKWRLFYGDTWEEARSKALDAWQRSPGEAKLDAMVLPFGVEIEHAAQEAGRKKQVEKAKTSASMRSTLQLLKRVDLDLIAMDGMRASVLMAGAIAIEDTEFEGKEQYLANVRERWRVWEKGYALLGDIDGILYVYCGPPEKRG